MKRLARMSLVMVALGTTACAAPVTIEPVAPASPQRFDRADAAAGLSRGTAMIRGAVVAKLGRESGSCTTVYLIPASRYTDQRMAALYGPDNGRALLRMDATAPVIEPAPAAWLETTLQGRCDTRGNFYLDQVGAGVYWLMVPLRWPLADQPQSGSVAQRVTVSPGQTVNLLLSP